MPMWKLYFRMRRKPNASLFKRDAVQKRGAPNLYVYAGMARNYPSATLEAKD